MIGSLIITFDERVNGRGGSFFDVTVNGQPRNTHYTDSRELYTTDLEIGDVCTICMSGQTQYVEQIGVIRRDYTTDAEDDNMGIYDNTITNQTGGPGFCVTFTATTVSNAYNFEYRIDMSMGPTPTPTPTVTPTATPTPTPILDDGKFLVVSDENRYVRFSNDYGINWTNFSGPVDGTASRGAIISTEGKYRTLSDSGYFISIPGSIWNSSNSGLTFTELTNSDQSNHWLDMDTSPNGIYQAAVDNQGAYYVSTDYGESFEFINLSVKPWIKPIIPGDVPFPYYGLTSNKIWKLNSLAGPFVEMTGLTTSGIFTDFAVSQDSQYIMATEEGFGLYVSTNSGSTFNITHIYGTVFQNAVCSMSADGRYMYVGWDQTVTTPSGRLYRSEDYGQTFTQVLLPPTNIVVGLVYSISVSRNGQYVYFVSLNSSGLYSLFSSNDYGLTWTKLNNATFEGLQFYNLKYVRQNKMFLGTAPTPGPTPTPPPSPTYGPNLLNIEWVYKWTNADVGNLTLNRFGHRYEDYSVIVSTNFINTDTPLLLNNGSYSGKTQTNDPNVLNEWAPLADILNRQITQIGSSRALGSRVRKTYLNGVLINTNTITNTSPQSFTFLNTSFPCSPYSGMTVVSGDTVTFEWEDNFVTPVPGPTPTPTPTATATPTPTPTVPPLFEIKSEYYVDGDIGTATNSKRSTLQYLFGPSLIDSTNFNWTTTPFSGSSSTNFVNPFSGVVGINRTAYQRTTFLPNQFLTGFTANILVNGSTVFTTGFTYSPPLEIPPDASADTKIINVSGITFNSNDVVKIQWFDGVNFVQPTPTPTATPTPTPTPTPAPATVQFRSKMVGGTGINKRHTNRIARFTIDNSSFEVIPFESFSTTSGNATVTTPSQNVLTIGSSITIYIERDLCRTTTGTLTRDTTLARVFINGSQVGSTCTTGTNTTVNLCPTVISNQYSTCLGTFTINSGDVIIVEIEDRFVQA